MKKSTILDQNETTTLLSQMVQRLPLSDTHFRRISQLIYQRAGIVLADHKREMVYNRLVRRLRTLNIDDFGRYLEAGADCLRNRAAGRQSGGWRGHHHERDCGQL